MLRLAAIIRNKYFQDGGYQFDDVHLEIIFITTQFRFHMILIFSNMLQLGYFGQEKLFILTAFDVN